MLISINSNKTFEEFSAKTRNLYTEAEYSKAHLYSISFKAHEKLKQTSQSQVISLLGYSGGGKTFAAIHLLDHLIHKSKCEFLFPLLHSSIQLIHVMGSVITNENMESTVCGLVVNLAYDENFTLSSAFIKAKLLDFTLPYSSSGKTYHVLHSLVNASKTQLSSLGLGLITNFKIFANKQPTALQQSIMWLKITK